jgi:drug/metabolite transporter, DME family
VTSSQQNFSSGVVFVLLATVGWSLSGLFVRFLPHLDGWQINCWRGFWMAVGLLIYLSLRYGHDLYRQFTVIPFMALMLSALCFAIGTTFYVTSLTLVSTATVSVIGALSPLVTGLLSPWITGEKPTRFAWAGALLALIGMVVIAKDGIETGNIAGLMTSLCVTLTFALQTLLLRRYSNFDMMPAICLGGFIAFIANGIIGLTLNGGGFNIDPQAMSLLALMGPLQLSIPLIFFARSARYLPAMLLSLIAMLDSILNPLWPWLFANEVPGSAAITGGAIILGAVLISIIGPQTFRTKS